MSAYKLQLQIAREKQDVIWRRDCREKILFPYVVFEVREYQFYHSLSHSCVIIVLSYITRITTTQMLRNTEHSLEHRYGYDTVGHDGASSWIRCCGSETVGVIHVAAVHVACMAVCLYLLHSMHFAAQRADSEDRTKDWAPPLIPYVVCVRASKYETHSYKYSTQILHHSWFRPVWIVTVLLCFKR